MILVCKIENVQGVPSHFRYILFASFWTICEIPTTFSVLMASDTKFDQGRHVLRVLFEVILRSNVFSSSFLNILEYHHLFL